jgi:hypothetical protein
MIIDKVTMYVQEEGDRNIFLFSLIQVVRSKR